MKRLLIFVPAYLGTAAIQLSDILSGKTALIKLLMAIVFFVFTTFLVAMLII